MKRSLVCLTPLLPIAVFAQLPGNEIVVADIVSDNNSIEIKNEINISDRKGYDNQPVFLDKDQSIYYTRFEKGQTDIYKYDINEKKSTLYMKSEESEYSATKRPGKKGLSVVRVEVDNIQHVYWLDNHKGKEKQRRVSKMKQVGYHNWTGKNHLWMFVINDSEGDLYYQKLGKEAKKIAANIGRSLKTDADSKELYFVNKNTQPYSIMKVHRKSEKTQFVMNLPEGEEDFELDAKGRFWTGVGNTLYVNEDSKWKSVKVFNWPQLSNISRIAVNSDATQIALVFDEVED